jgi:Protein of unknown function (DUF2423)
VLLEGICENTQTVALRAYTRVMIESKALYFFCNFIYLTDNFALLFALPPPLDTLPRLKSTMAKSTRSKAKRAFRAKKRTEGVYAATEAARLQRLNAKLHALTTATTTITTAAAGKDVSKKEEQENDDDDDVELPGSCWFAAFGLLDQQVITPALMNQLGL